MTSAKRVRQCRIILYSPVSVAFSQSSFKCLEQCGSQFFWDTPVQAKSPLQEDFLPDIQDELLISPQLQSLVNYFRSLNSLLFVEGSRICSEACSDVYIKVAQGVLSPLQPHSKFLLPLYLLIMYLTPHATPGLSTLYISCNQKSMIERTSRHNCQADGFSFFTL